MCVRYFWTFAWLTAVMALFLGPGIESQSLAQGWPQLDIQIQSYPSAYRVIATTTNGRPVKSDLVLNAVVNSNTYRGGAVIASRELIIQSGKTSGFAEIPFLRSQKNWVTNNIIVEVDKNERFNRNDYLKIDASPNNWFDEYSNQFIYVSSDITSAGGQSITANTRKQFSTGSFKLAVKDPKKLPSFAELMPVYESNGWITSGSVTGDLSFLQATENTPSYITGMPPVDFFHDWKCLVNVQAIFVSAADLAVLAGSQQQLETLQKWLYAGGNLVVLDAGTNFEDRDKITSLVGKRNSPTPWLRPSDDLLAVKGFAAHHRWNITTNAKVVEIGSLPLQIVTAIDDVTGQELVMTEMMEGRLILANSDMVSADSSRWQILYNLLISQKSTNDIVGMHCQSGGYHQQFRIPGIGNPPLIAFQILIGMYVLVIGPGLYYFLNSTGRLYLLLVTVPAISFVAVFSLFAYGIINDGFATRGRIRSVTILDQQLKQAVTHSRYAYYSGVRPSANLFPKDVFISNSRSANNGITVIRNISENQVISGGHIKARTPFQLTSLGVQDCESKVLLNLDETNTTGKLANNFEDRILFAVVHVKGKWFYGADIAPNEIGTVTEDELSNIKNGLRKHTNRIKLDPYFQSNRFRSNYSIENDSQNWGLSSDLVSELNSGWLNEDSVPENSYLLVLESNSLIPNPQPNAELGENQLHVLIGKW